MDQGVSGCFGTNLAPESAIFHLNCALKFISGPRVGVNMKWLQSITIVLTIALGCQGAFGQPGGEIGMVSYFLGSGPWASWSGQWLALLERDGGFELREVTATSSRDEKPICGDIGFNVDASPAAPGALLLRGFPTIKAGPVVTGFHGRKFLHPG
jgi:hypothetical protein